MLYNDLHFEFSRLQYNLHFDSKVTLVWGNSGTGKTYLYNILVRLKTLPEYSDIVCIDKTTTEPSKLLQSCHNKFVVIDNADIILTDTDKTFISWSNDNQFLIFGRNCDGLGTSLKSFVTLERSNNQLYFRKEFF